VSAILAVRRSTHAVAAPLKHTGGTMSRHPVAALLLCAIWLPALSAFGGSPPGGNTEAELIRKHESRHFVVYTDLSDAEASKTVANLERTLRVVSRYWARRLAGQIECYVVEDLDRWPRGALPHPAARVLLQRVGGGTQMHAVQEGSRRRKQTRIFCRATPGIAEHEVAHAYCTQVFGTCGPDWYSEGMAQLASFHQSGDPAVSCPDKTIDTMRMSPPLTVDAVLTDRAFTAPLSATFARLSKSRRLEGATEEAVSGHGTWNAGDDEVVRQAETSYAASWALCHLMSHHTRYRNRFRRMGRQLLAGQDANFNQTFAGWHAHIGFEFAFFVDHVEPGYRVDLCEWDWDSRIVSLESGESMGVEVKAARGYQSAGIRVASGRQYTFRSTGTWKTDARSQPVTADGNPGGEGRLVGILLDAFALTAPFDMGADGTFRANQSGQLFVRCRDKWHELADNSGTVRVTLQLFEPDESPGP